MQACKSCKFWWYITSSLRCPVWHFQVSECFEKKCAGVLPHVVSFLHGQTNSATESSRGCGGNASTFKEMFVATVSGGFPTQDGVCHPTSAYISSLFLQVRFCPRLTSHRPILSYAARTKRKSSSPKGASFWNKLRIMHIEIQFCTIIVYRLYCSLACSAVSKVSVCCRALQKDVCAHAYVNPEMQLLCLSFSVWARWQSEKEYVCGMEDRWKKVQYDGRTEIVTCEKPVATHSSHHIMMLGWPDTQLLLHSGRCHFDCPFCETFKAAKVPWFPSIASLLVIAHGEVQP